MFFFADDKMYSHLFDIEHFIKVFVNFFDQIEHLQVVVVPCVRRRQQTTEDDK